MNNLDKTVRDFKKALSNSGKQTTSPYDTQAEVVRVDGDTAWVHIPGGVDETPVQMTSSAKKGDIVQVRVSGGRAWLYGNATNPPTDDSKAIAVDKKVDALDTKVVENVNNIKVVLSETNELVAYAIQSADGKSTVYHAAIAPTGGDYKVGDTWFNSSEGYAIYTWNGTTWVKEELGSDAIANLAITNAKIADATIQSAKIAGLDVGKLTGGYIDAGHINTASLTIGSSTLGEVIDDKADKSNTVSNVVIEYGVGNSSTSYSDITTWGTSPTWSEGKYVWQRTTKVIDGNTTYTYACIQGAQGPTGATGAQGEDAVLVYIHSSEGMAFKNDSVSTTLSVIIYYGNLIITNKTALTNAFGNGTYLQWKLRLYGESGYTTIPSSDSRLSNDGFIFELSPSDVNVQAVFNVEILIPD